MFCAVVVVALCEVAGTIVLLCVVPSTTFCNVETPEATVLSSWEVIEL